MNVTLLHRKKNWYIHYYAVEFTLSVSIIIHLHYEASISLLVLVLGETVRGTLELVLFSLALTLGHQRAFVSCEASHTVSIKILLLSILYCRINLINVHTHIIAYNLSSPHTLKAHQACRDKRFSLVRFNVPLNTKRSFWGRIFPGNQLHWYW